MGRTILASTRHGSMTSGKGRGGGKGQRKISSPAMFTDCKPARQSNRCGIRPFGPRAGFLTPVVDTRWTITTARRHENVIIVLHVPAFLPRNAVLSLGQWSPTGNPCMNTHTYLDIDCRPLGIVIILFPARPALLDRRGNRFTADG